MESSPRTNRHEEISISSREECIHMHIGRYVEILSLLEKAPTTLFRIPHGKMCEENGIILCSQNGEIPKVSSSDEMLRIKANLVTTRAASEGEEAAMRNREW